MSELEVVLKVPQNAKNLSFNFAFLSSEYPEWVCTAYNDRFLAILESQALNPGLLTPPDGGSPGSCVTGAPTPTCNTSFDGTGQPVSVNNGFFDICVTASGGTGAGAWTNTCTKPTSLLAMTGYDLMQSGQMIGGSTGWLTTTAPVKPGETIKLRLIVLDEGDSYLDSAVLIDNFKWGVTGVTAPVTVDPGIN